MSKTPPNPAPILALPPPSCNTNNPPILTPNLLPAKIHHSGPIPITPRHWNPRPLPAKLPQDEKNTTTTSSPPPLEDGKVESESESHLRGRRLLGHHVPLPPGYTGLIIQRTDTILSPAGAGAAREDEVEEEEEEEEEARSEIKGLETLGTFDEVVVWDHERLPDAEGDVYIRGLREWIAVAGCVNCVEGDGDGDV